MPTHSTRPHKIDPMQRLLAPLALAALSAAPALAQGQVHVVDSLGGAGAMFATKGVVA